tara:strand:- start:4412 stop:4696 length:285 start_codon:yes stop_codon:yes gene_type:complete
MENPINEKEWTEFEDDLHFDLDFNSRVVYQSMEIHEDYSDYGGSADQVSVRVIDVAVKISVGEEKMIVPVRTSFKKELREMLEEYLTNQVRGDY